MADPITIKDADSRLKRNTQERMYKFNPYRSTNNQRHPRQFAFMSYIQTLVH